MIVGILLLLTVAAAGGGWLRRRHIVDDPAVSDGAVLRVDAIAAGVGVLLVTAAALAAATVDIDQRTWIATQVIAVVAAAASGSSVVRMVLSAGGIPTRADNHDDEPDVPLRGGRVIGMCERTAVAVTLLMGWPAGVGVILAVKGLARFSELRAPRASEQFIIGTFASVLWACALAGVGYLAGI